MRASVDKLYQKIERELDKNTYGLDRLDDHLFVFKCHDKTDYKLVQKNALLLGFTIDSVNTHEKFIRVKMEGRLI